MGKGFSLFILLACLAAPICKGQSSIQVSHPRLELMGNEVHISYDILNTDPTEDFTIHVVVRNREGEVLNSSSLSGDVGDGVKGGRDRLIIWNLEADQILLTTRISVEIMVRPYTSFDSEASLQVNQQPGQLEKATRQGMESGSQADSDGFNRTAIVFQSLVVPGLGLSRVTGKPHWIRGVLGYSCIAGSVILNKLSIETYAQIDDLEDYETKNEYFEEAVNQDQVSEILAYAAIGIWITDFIWTLAGTSDLKKSAQYGNVDGLSLKTSIDPMTYAPMVGVRYKF